MKKYVLGFAFDACREFILLIRKNRPMWQAGLLNGIGGHIEPSDASPSFAMAREFFEETSIVSHPEQWQHFATMTDNETWSVECFFSRTLPIRMARTMTDEPVVLYPLVEGLGSSCISNLRWLIPMIADKNLSDRPPTIVYKPSGKEAKEIKESLDEKETFYDGICG